MKIEFTLKATIYEPSRIEEIEAPQIPLAGRSNVGKSSLINSLAGKRRLAKTSSSPGKTRSINLYFIRPYRFYIVDLPGYGYARVSKQERLKWSEMVDAYLEANREHIRCVVLLIDSRIPPQKGDMELASYLTERGIEVFPVLTKADKAKMGTRTSGQQFWKGFLSLESVPLLFSAKTGMNKGRLWQHLIEKASSSFN